MFRTLNSRTTFAVQRHVRAAFAHTMTPEQIKLVKGTAPVLAQYGLQITTTFYKNIFAKHPELNNIFNQAHQRTGTQPTALAKAVFAYAANIDNLGVLGEAVAKIGHKHASLMVQKEHYPVVGENLLAAVKEVLGDAIDDKTVEAWRVAYGQLADILIDFEAKLYYDAAHTPGGWAGWRKFRVSDKIVESGEITSFHLTPVDGGAVPAYKPGQFVSVKTFVPSLGYDQPRQYSLSTAPNNAYFRISVKREIGAPDGVVSNLLHDLVGVGSTIDVSPPMGDFCLDTAATTPVVLVSGGVGLTPMLSMLDTIVAQCPQRQVSFIHGCRNASVHALKHHLHHTVRAHGHRVQKSVWYEDASQGGQKGVDFDMAGRIQLSEIASMVTLPQADYYLCGPIPFMNDMEKQLLALNIPKEKIHSEVFGSETR